MQFTAVSSTLLVLITSTLVHATLRLSDIQALVNFPQKCSDAYNTPIDACYGAHFKNGPLCSCSSACSNALDSATETIVNACQGTAASPESLIGLFFEHAATEFLCTPPANGGGGGCPSAQSGSGSLSSSSSSSNHKQSTSSTASSSTSTRTSTRTSQSSSSSSSTTTTTTKRRLSETSTSTTQSTSSTTSPSSSIPTNISASSSSK